MDRQSEKEKHYCRDWHNSNRKCRTPVASTPRAKSEDSPNAYMDGKKPRGNRGGRKERKQKQGSKPRIRIKVQNAGQNGGAGVYSPQPLQTNPALLKSAEESAEALARLVGRSAKKVKRGVTIDVEKLTRCA